MVTCQKCWDFFNRAFTSALMWRCVCPKMLDTVFSIFKPLKFEERKLLMKPKMFPPLSVEACQHEAASCGGIAETCQQYLSSRQLLKIAQMEPGNGISFEIWFLNAWSLWENISIFMSMTTHILNTNCPSIGPRESVFGFVLPRGCQCASTD